ncbi:MAG: DNA mismatch repair endonuclease MutL [Desulfobacterales bacterium]|nr:DNA mismatch repair endonuclease MutL [Desulfobacterales bacterium]
MSIVRILPDILSNKIAAGEVVERPASVVKELVENALDAGSQSVTIEIEKGGRALIRISDDGCGMAPDDAMLAIERYATSKIYTDEDLFNITTLGFRGEALPSIASVSKFTLTSRPEDRDVGCEIVMEGGKVKQVGEAGVPKGTQIAISHLFFNTPARRKFLKGEGTEMSHIGDTVSAIALAWPAVRFRLLHNGKLVKSWPATESLKQRVEEVLGRDVRGALHEVTLERGELVVHGFVSNPQVTRSTTSKIYLYVNGRPVKDRVVLNALLSGYRPRLMKGRFPMGMIAITLPCDWVDVNVHPAKNEVRFRDASAVADAVEAGVSAALCEADKKSRRFGGTSSLEGGRPLEPSLAPVSRVPVAAESTPLFEEAETAIAVEDELPPAYDFTGSFTPSFVEEKVEQAPVGTFPKESSSKEIFDEKKEREEIGHSEERPLGQFEGLRVIGQFARTYILCEGGDGLVLIDQHAAHERIVFEKLKAGGQRLSQRLLMPETVELGFKEADALSAISDDLLAYGLEVEHFGGTTFVVKSVPGILASDTMARLVAEIAEKMVAMGRRDTLEKALDECLILMACHCAIRAGQKLSSNEILSLLKELDACKEPSFCPHGRPTWIRWSQGALERSFKR